MKKNVCVIIAMLLLGGCLYGQYKSIIVPAGTKIIDNFPPPVRYMYPEFVEGEVILNNGLSSVCMVNYNMLRDEIEFLQENDTLIIGRKRELKYVIAESDTFIYMPGYIKLIYNQKLKVYCRDRFYLKEILKKGAMGAVNRSAGIGSFSDFEQQTIRYDLVVPEDYVYKREVAYYIATSKGTYEPIKKNNILKLFSYHKADIQKYLKTNKTNFEKQDDIIKLAEFLSTL
jgi:hypothetical protein